MSAEQICLNCAHGSFGSDYPTVYGGVCKVPLPLPVRKAVLHAPGADMIRYNDSCCAWEVRTPSTTKADK